MKASPSPKLPYFDAVVHIHIKSDIECKKIKICSDYRIISQILEKRWILWLHVHFIEITFHSVLFKEAGDLFDRCALFAAWQRCCNSVKYTFLQMSHGFNDWAYDWNLSKLMAEHKNSLIQCPFLHLKLILLKCLGQLDWTKSKFTGGCKAYRASGSNFI